MVRVDQHNTIVDGRGRLWLAVPGLRRRRMVRIPLSTTVAPAGTLRLILRGGRVEVHYQIDAAAMRSSRRPCGQARVGVDEGYTEALTDSEGQPHGTRLGELLTAESDRLKERNRRRAKLPSIANNAAGRGDQAKAHRIKINNLGTVKRDRQADRHRAQVRTEVFTAVHEVVDKAACTAQTCHRCGRFGRRSGHRFHRTMCGVVWQADVNTAINILQRAGDPDNALHTPYHKVKQILRDRTDRHRTRLQVQDSSPTTTAERRAKHPNCSAVSN